MDRLTVWTILYVFISGLKATNGGDCIGQDTSQFVCCSLLTVENGKVCYAWHWSNSLNGNAFVWSSATFSCNPGYVLSSFQNVLQCVRNDNTWCESCGSCHSWNGSLPVCQEQETTGISSSPSPLSTTKTTTLRISKTSLAATIAITTQRTPQRTTPMTFLISRPSTVGSTNLSSAFTFLGDGHNLFSLYVAVPTVVVVGAVVAVLLIVLKRHQKKQNGLISNCRGKSAREEFSNRTETDEPCYRNLQLDAIVDECQEVDKAYTSLRIERENGMYETMGSGAIPMNTKKTATIAGGQTIDDKAYTSLCFLKENNAYSILGTVP